MLFLLIEINSYRQLEKIKTSLVEDIRRCLSTTLHLDEGDEPFNSEGYLFYPFSKEHTDNPEYILEIVLKSYQCLYKRRDELNGFGIILDSGKSEENSGTYRLIKSRLRSVEDDESLWIGEEAARHFGHRVGLSRKGDVYKVVSKRKEWSAHVKGFETFAPRTEHVGRVIDGLTGYLNRSADPGFLYVYGSDMIGKRATIHAALRTISGKEENYWLAIYTTGKTGEAYEPFLSSIRKPYFKEVEYYLRPTEKKVWDGKREFLYGALKDFPHENVNECLTKDFYISYLLYLTSYIRYMKELLVPAFFVIEDVHRFARKSLELVQMILQNFLKEPDFIPVVTGNTSAVPQELQGLQHRKLRIPQLQSSELSGFVDKLKQGHRNYSLEQLRKVSRGKILSLYHFLIFKEWGEDELIDVFSTAEDNSGLEEQFSPTKNIILRLDNATKLVLFVLALSQKVLDLESFYEFMAELKINRSRLEKIITDLIKFGFLREPFSLGFTYPPIGKVILKMLEAEHKGVREDICDFLMDCIHSKKRGVSLHLFNFLRSAGKEEYEEEVLKALVDRELRRNAFPAIKTLLQSEAGKGSLIEKNLRYLCSLRIANCRQEVDTAVSLVKEQKKTNEPEFKDDFLGGITLETGRAYFLGSEIEKSMQMIKRALLHYQEQGDARGVCLAHLELGMVLLANGKLDDALDYFFIARSTANQSGDTYGLLNSLTMEAIAFYLVGNFSRIFENIEFGLPIAQRYGSSELELFLTFLEGRLNFDLGNYDEAEKCFERGLSISRLYEHGESQSLFYKWLARTFLYQDKIVPGKKILEALTADSESLFFLGEAYSFLKRPEKTLEILTDAHSQIQNSESSGFHTINWKTGYSYLENLVIGREGGRGVLQNLISGYTGYIKGTYGKPAEGIKELHTLIREKKISQLDPNTILYYFFYGMILPENKEPGVDDKLTILRIAVKYLQERAGKIESSSDKSNFLHNNYWNRQLVREARKFNLF